MKVRRNQLKKIDEVLDAHPYAFLNTLQNNFSSEEVELTEEFKKELREDIRSGKSSLIIDQSVPAIEYDSNYWIELKPVFSSCESCD